MVLLLLLGPPAEEVPIGDPGIFIDEVFILILRYKKSLQYILKGFVAEFFATKNISGAKQLVVLL
jgi:hypothetical protein